MKNVIIKLKEELYDINRSIDEQEPCVKQSDLNYQYELRKAITILECIDSFT